MQQCTATVVAITEQSITLSIADETYTLPKNCLPDDITPGDTVTISVSSGADPKPQGELNVKAALNELLS